MSLKAGDNLEFWLHLQLGKMGRKSFSEEEQKGKHRNFCEHRLRALFLEYLPGK